MGKGMKGYRSCFIDVPCVARKKENKACGALFSFALGYNRVGCT